MRRWTDIAEDDEGWVEIEVETDGVRTVFEKVVEEGGAERSREQFLDDLRRNLRRPEPSPCDCEKCRAILRRVRRRRRRVARRKVGVP